MANKTARVGGTFYLLTALALSIGWGIRGNFGHEYGAMMPGALAALAVALASGRDDWRRRAPYFALFAALGWSFGGSISYMMVIAYTHSGHSPSVAYGFANLFVIGFLWAAPGGAGTALAAYADRDRLTELFAPMTAVFVAWWLQGAVIAPRLTSAGFNLNWFDTDWLAATLAAVTALLFALARRRFDRATSLILYMAVGWWLGFLILVVGLGLRMTPPRGDNWSGCLGMVVGLLVYLARNDLRPVARVTLITGFGGGISFAGASMLKLLEVTSGYETNWHSVLEQSTGLMNGLALAYAMSGPVFTAPATVDVPRTRRWTEVYAVGFVLLMITYLNSRKNVNDWVKANAVPAEMGGLPSWLWFDLAYAAIALAVLLPLIRHLRRPLAILPADPLGRGQWLFLVFLWWCVVFNFDRIVVAFQPQRLITEGVITLNAALTTLILLLCLGPARALPARVIPERVNLRRTLAVGVAVSALCILVDWSVVRAVYGDRFAGHASMHIRFGPNNTNTRKK